MVETPGATPFITTWETTVASESITIPTNTNNHIYNYSVDWGDGNSDSDLTGDAMHTYSNAGTHTVSITGIFPAIYFFSNSSDDGKIKTIEQWGNQNWQSMNGAFSGCSNLTYNATDKPDLSETTIMDYMFDQCPMFNGAIGDWDVSTITSMVGTFSKATVFNQDLNDWDMSNVTTLSNLFSNARAFNGNITGWDVGKVTSMNSTFNQATSFNQDISSWDVSNVIAMSSMFQVTSSFDQDLSAWDVSKVQSMRLMFWSAKINQNFGAWNLKSINSASTSSMWRMLNLTQTSVANYDACLIGWANNSETPDNVNFGADRLKYSSAGEVARNTLLAKGWTIVGDSKE